MGYEKVIPLADITGDIIGLLGLLAMFWLGRRLRIKGLAAALGFTLFLAYLCLRENLVPAVRLMLPVEYRLVLIPDLITVWFFCMVLTALFVFLRSRLPGVRSGRRQFLSTSTAALCATPAIALATGYIRRKQFHVNEVNIQIPGLAKDLHDLRLVQISDLHTGAFFTTSDVARVVDVANSLRPHLTFVTGDLITTRWDPLDACLLQLRRLNASSGVWACMGNHERFAEIEDYVEQKSKRFGIRFLRSEAALLKFGDAQLNLAGVDYQRHNHPYLTHAEKLVAPDSLNVLLSHNPDVFPVAAAKGFDLTIAGHTHGGQINFEILGKDLNIADFFTPYTKGFYSLPGSSLYVNSGLGTIGMPVRLGAPPEITLIRLCNT